MKNTKGTKKRANLKYLLLGIVTRLIGLVVFACGIVLMVIPFIAILLFAGINKANVIMSTVMRQPMNMVLGEGMGDVILEVHKDIDKATNKKTENNL